MCFPDSSMHLKMSATNIIRCLDVPRAEAQPAAILHTLLETTLKRMGPASDGRLTTVEMATKGVTCTSSAGTTNYVRNVKITFPPTSPWPARIAKHCPTLLMDGTDASSDRRVNCHATATALIQQIKLQRIQAGSSPTSEDSDSDTESLGVASEQSSSASSGVVQTVDSETAIVQLEALIADNIVPPPSVREMERQIQEVIVGMWPRLKHRGSCMYHKRYETGASNRTCSAGDTCRYDHSLKTCSRISGGGCKKSCSWLHYEEICDLTRLDVSLARHCNVDFSTIVPTDAIAVSSAYSELVSALSVHRRKMLAEGERLLLHHDKRLLDAKNSLCALQQQDVQSVAAAAVKAKSIQTVGGQIQEIERQIESFRRSRATFMESAFSSFRSARIFAREVYNRFKTCLPIYAQRQTIVDALRDDFAVLVLSAETGSGKSTQVVQYMEEDVTGQVWCTQPRRVAAVTLADRVAEEMQTQRPSKNHANLVAARSFGSDVDKSKTRIHFMTDASLLNTLYYNPLLSFVSVVVVDEVHERSVNTDLLVALLRQTLRLRCIDGRHPFKLVLTSATMNENLFARYFARKFWDPQEVEDATWARVLKVGGRTYPVTVHYALGGSQPRYEVVAEQKAVEVHRQLPPTNPTEGENNDILVFLAQTDEVDRLTKRLQEQLPECLCVALHGSLDKDEQRRAFIMIDPLQHQRKIVVATNIAEASVTIDGIGVVIDTGVSKTAVYDPKKDATVLRVSQISQGSARQRAGRAGRTAPGVCYRLYSEAEYEDMEVDQLAELLRIDATAAILTVLRQITKRTNWITDVREFPFVEHPGKDRLERSLEMLWHLGAIESREISTLTSAGEAMSRMQCSPRVAAILFEAKRLGVLEQTVVATTMLDAAGTLFRRGRTEEEKEHSMAQRQKFSDVFPDRGDVGVGIAVWLDAPRDASFGIWCREHAVSPRTAKSAMRTVASLLKDMSRADGVQDVQDVPTTAQDTEVSSHAMTDSSGTTREASTTADSFRNAEIWALVLRSFVAG